MKRMCGIVGWVDWQKNLAQQMETCPVLERMARTLAPRGPDAEGFWVNGHCAFGHRRLSVIDPENGAQPMIYKADGQLYCIVYNGELYNTLEIRKMLEQLGYRFRTNCDTEVLLLAYVQWGAACLEQLAGIFAFAVWNGRENKLFLARDRLGVKPLFFSHSGERLIFGSEPKAILAHPDMRAEVDAEGLAEIFAMGPARTPGHGIYKGMRELKPGQYAEFDLSGLRVKHYWQLESMPHPDDERTTIGKVRELLRAVTESQLVSDVPVGMLLSGGLDSSVLTALAASRFRADGKEQIRTFSVDYAGNDRHFQAHAFQPDADGPWIRRISAELGTEHHNAVFSTEELVDSLKPAVLARDFPGMADVDGSLLLFTRRVKEFVTVALSGEGADEVFGGYPWYHREEMIHADTFPWSVALDERLKLLSPDLISMIKPRQYVAERYQEAIGEVPHLDGETPHMRKMRQLTYLNITRFMPTLLDRKDRMSMAASLEVRVPFCDHRLVEYVWNIPWEMKTLGGHPKGILRKAARGILPEDVLQRKKSPYPKTHDPQYVQALRTIVTEMLEDPSSPILPFINRQKVKQFIRADASQLQRPWFGQLMSGPQMLAYLVQIDIWLREYKVAVRV
jgi:asparagine synthase (glutamine-hydrolysing)